RDNQIHPCHGISPCWRVVPAERQQAGARGRPRALQVMRPREPGALPAKRGPLWRLGARQNQRLKSFRRVWRRNDLAAAGEMPEAPAVDLALAQLEVDLRGRLREVRLFELGAALAAQSRLELIDESHFG